jgi:hypothetical protein
MLGGCPLAIGQIRRRIGHVHLDPLDQRAEGHNKFLWLPPMVQELSSLLRM